MVRRSYVRCATRVPLDLIVKRRKSLNTQRLLLFLVMVLVFSASSPSFAETQQKPFCNIVRGSTVTTVSHGQTVSQRFKISCGSTVYRSQIKISTTAYTGTSQGHKLCKYENNSETNKAGSARLVIAYGPPSKAPSKARCTWKVYTTKNPDVTSRFRFVRGSLPVELTADSVEEEHGLPNEKDAKPAGEKNKENEEKKPAAEKGKASQGV